LSTLHVGVATPLKAVRSLIQIRIRKLQRSLSARATPVFKDPGVAETLSTIHDKYVVVPANKAPTNIVFMCNKHYIDCLKIELGLDSSQGNDTYRYYVIKRGNH
jgi:hypothetical protein